MQEQICSLLGYLCDERGSAAAINWAPPIPAFGDPSTAQVATLGINPSNREFVDQHGKELSTSQRRFPSLKSLELSNWKNATDIHIAIIAEACREYFENKPYNGWFRPLDFLLSKVEASYYNPLSNAVHLDIIPYATHKKWARLSPDQTRSLAGGAGNQLGHLLRDSSAMLVVLNGMAVVRAFQNLCTVELSREAQPKWALLRKEGATVCGYSYRGVTRAVGDVVLGREVMVLGFNHNVQSSFGVSLEIREAMRDWIGTEWRRLP